MILCGTLVLSSQDKSTTLMKALTCFGVLLETILPKQLTAVFIIPELRQKILMTLLFLAIYRMDTISRCRSPISRRCSRMSPAARPWVICWALCQCSAAAI